MSVIEIVLGVILTLAGTAAVFALRDCFGTDAYHRAYDKAQQEDLRYYAEHPGCTLEEAHRNRDRVNRRFGR